MLRSALKNQESHAMLLRDLRVLDLGSYVAGPATATVLSDFGADVVKVEPLDGDPYRRLLGAVVAEYPNFFWDQDARNKRSLAIDFTTPIGRDALERLIRRSDIVITNYRPQLLARLKLSYEDVRTIKEDVIYGQVNSYGLVGPDANRTGFDATMCGAPVRRPRSRRPAWATTPPAWRCSAASWPRSTGARRPARAPTSTPRSWPTAHGRTA